MAKKDIYLSWNEHGNLQEMLAVISMLVKSGISEKPIAKALGISVTEYRKLCKEYPDLLKANDPEDIGEMIACFKTLRKIAHGYTKKTIRKNYYTGKKQEQKYCVEEIETFVDPNPQAVLYILEKFYGSTWSKNAEQIELQKEKMNKNTEVWSNGNPNDGD